MSDTIELLETIGSDSSLRHAPMDELSRRLEQAEASEALLTAVTSGNITPLSSELGQKPMRTTQSSQTVPGQEEKEPDEDESDEAGRSERESSQSR